MPIYSYKCDKCGKQVDELQRYTDPAPKCCGEDMKRTLAQTARPQFKGSGFYETDYKGKKR